MDEKPEILDDETIAARLAAVKDKLKVDLEDVDGKLADILGGTTTDLPEDPDEAKLAALRQRAEALKSKRDAQKVEADRQSRQAQESSQGLGAGLTIAYTILGIPLIGGILGVILKGQTGNPQWVVICGLGGMVLGVIGAVAVAKRTKQ